MSPVRKQSKQYAGKYTQTSSIRLNPANAVELVINNALKTSASKMGLRDKNAFIECIKTGNPSACSYCHYYIAKELGEVLGTLDKNIRAVYAYGYDDNTSAEECSENISSLSPVHMIIWAERKTKALTALLESMDRAMVQHQRSLMGLKELEHMLDIQVVDDVDIKNRTGYATLLSSIHQSPVQVWSSNHKP